MTNIIRKLREKGIVRPLKNKINHFICWLRINNKYVGKLVECLGNKVRMDGFVYYVSTPTITTEHKGTLFFGLHEIEEREQVKKFLPSDKYVIELGGGLGVISCLANKRLNQPRNHIVFEANAGMIDVLEANKEKNDCQFVTLNKAIAYGVEWIEFSNEEHFTASRLSNDNKSVDVSRVTAVTLADIVDEFNIGEFSLISDIEGAEQYIIDNELELLSDKCKSIIIEMHPLFIGEDRVAELLQKLGSKGFSIVDQMQDNYVLEKA